MSDTIVEMLPSGDRRDLEITQAPRRKSLVRFTSIEDGDRPRVITRIPTRVELTTLTRMAKRPAVDIEFQDLTFKAGQKQILKGINGIFKSGELTCIMGPSGAGKSTLMNILVGYVTSGVTGSIITNGHPRQLKLYNKLSSYIMQEDLLQPNLTVYESMLVAAHLKLGNELSKQDKERAVDEILTTLGLLKCKTTRTERLSGGQRKRVSVALELVNNPPVIFLDEPTTGLDIVSINSCVKLLKDLSRQGRTIVCTIHQPSATLFHMFDLVYMLARGVCIYQGSSQQLVPYLNHCGLRCPETYNPADYIFEVLQHDIINHLTSEIQNGRIIKLDPKNENESPRSKLLGLGSTLGDNYSSGRQGTVATMPNVYGDTKTLQFATSFAVQYWILLRRMLMQRCRNSTAFYLQVIHHVFSGVIVGTIFWNIGNNGSKPFENFKFCLSVAVFFMYTYVMVPVLVLPMEMKLLRREFFNRWYGLKAFYLSKTMSTIPTTIMLTMTFNTIVYWMADQPMEISRFFWFCSINIVLAIISEGLGILIGILFNCTNGAVVGPSVMAPILMVAMHGMGYGQNIHKVMQFIMQFSFMRLTLVGLLTTLYSNGRGPMECKDNNPIHYCHYRDPGMLLRDLGMQGQDTTNQLLGLIGYLLLFRVLAYFAMRFRLTTELRSRIIGYVHKIIKH